MSLEGENDFTGKLRLPLPPTFSGKPAEWEEWSWKFRAYLSMFDAQAARYLEQHENDEAPLTDEALEVHVLTEEGVAALDQTATAGRVTFSRKLHYLLANLTSESALLVVRQNYDSNGFETWRRLVKKFALPDAARHVSLLTQLLDFRFGSHTFEQDFNTWETIKTKYERQTGADLPDSVLVATLLNKTSGALQQHLRLNARTLTTYEDIKATIVEYYQSRHLIMSNSSSSNQGPAPMDIGGLKGKKGFGKSGFGYFKGKGKGKSKSKGKNPHLSFHTAQKGKGKGKDFGGSKGKGKGKSKGKLRGQHALACWTCGKPGHVSANCPLGRVSAVDENATLDGSFEDWSVDDTWQVGDFEEEWWSDDLVAAVGLGWSDEEWWPAWDDGWSSTWSDWNDDTWSVVSPPPAVEKATSAPPSHAAEPKATSGAPVSAVTLGTPPARLSSAAKPKATPKATSKASGLAIAAITLGSMFAGTQSCFVSPTCDASLDCMLSGSIVFDGFGRSLGARSDVATWQLSPVCDLPLKNEANQTSLSNPTSLSDWGLEHLSSTFYDPYLAEHEVAVASVETGLETWILFDSGAAANCCPPDFAPDFPLLKLEERAPPLKSISGQTLQIYGRKLVAFELDGQRLWLNFYVCDVPYSVISVARLLQQGCKAVLTSEGSQLEGPTGATFPVTRHGSLLFLCPTLAEFDPNEYADFSKGFHEQFAVRPPPGLVAPTLKPTYYHADSWVLDEANATLTRLHKRGRATLFSPEGTKDRPVELKDLTGERVTVMNFEDGSSKTLNDDWRKSDDPRAKQDKYFKGKTVFKLASKPTGRRLVGKQSTLPRPEVHVEMPPPVPSSRTSTQKLSPEVVLRDHGEYADTFRKRVFDLVADEAVDPMKGLENFVKRSLDDVDPQTNEAYTHDTWVQLPTMWIRLHRQPRKNLFVPSERSEGGPNLSELSKARVTIQLDDHGSMKVDEDDWTLEGADRDVVEPFACGGATCFEKRDLYVKEIPEVAEPDLFETSARRPRGLPAPSEPTLTERKEHELTHLPFRSWCPICVRAKSKQNHSRTLKTKQPVVQLDYCFLGDNPEEPQVTLLTAVDLLSGMGLSCVVPAKGRSVYAQAELRRYILEIGRTFGILQIDPEPSLKALVAEFTSEVGGLSVRHSPTGWKQAQGAVGVLQSNLYAQIRTLKLDLEGRYSGFTLQKTHPLFTWLVKHAQWLMNRYAHKSDGLTSFEKRWGKPYNGALCRFAEVVHFRKIGKFPKSDAAWEEGLWLGRDTESNQHFVGTPQGVIKIRSLRRRPPSEQLDLALVQSLKATPWDPRGTKVETDHFVFPPQQPRPGENLVEPPDDPDAIPENLGNAGDLAQELEQDMLRELQSTSETRTAADLPVPEGPMDAEELAERQDKRSHEEPTSSAERASSEPATSRRRVGVTTERKRDTSEVPEAATKVQRISSLVRSPDQQMRIFDLRISAVTTKQELEVPVCVNQDETEISLAERLSNPLFWQSPEFTYEEEKAGMNKEMKSMIDFDVFTEQKMSDLTPEQLATVISTKWVKVRKGDGTCRCRLVVRGYDQLIDDPDDTYASTPSLLTLKTLLTLAVARGWHITLADISTAFLHALVDGDVWVLPPVEYYPEGGVVWKLKRALYGLKNAPALWQTHLAATLEAQGFQRMKSDPNLYFHAGRKVYVLCYVDDLMLFGAKKDVDAIVASLQKELLLRITGELVEGSEATFLGRKMRRTPTSVEMYMSATYVEGMLAEAGMSTCKPAPSPGTDALKKVSETAEALNPEEHKRYRKLVGQLLWMCNLRMDIMYAVKELSRGLASPTTDHWAKLKHLLRYLAGTKEYVQELRPNIRLSEKHSSLDVHTYVDSDWAGDPDTRRSTSGVATYLLGVNLQSHSRTQQTIALSSGEAELYAIGGGAADALFLRSLLLESRLIPKVHLFLHTDSTAGKSMASRYGTSRKTGHVQLRYLYVQELVTSGMVIIRKVLGTLNSADVLTKYVSKETLARHVGTLGLRPRDAM